MGEVKIVKKRTIVLLVLGAIILIIGVPVALDWLIIGNDIPSNISNSDWIGFLSGYIGAIIGGVVSLIGVSMSIIFTKQQLMVSKEQYEEQKRLNNLPSLYCQIDGVGFGDTIDCIDLNLDRHSHEVIVALEITNIGTGVASNLSYAIYENSRGEEGQFWIWKNRVILSQKQITQKLKLGLPKNEQNKIEIHIYYEDVLRNKYKKRLVLCERNSTFFVLSQDEGKLIPPTDMAQYLVVFHQKED